MILEYDCGTSSGLEMIPLIEGGDVVEPLRDRVLGRVVAAAVFKAGVDAPVVVAGTLLDENGVDRLEQEGVDRIKVRSAITCELLLWDLR